MKSCLNVCHSVSRSYLKSLLRNQFAISICVDGWRCQYHYIGVTAQWIDDSMTMQCAPLGLVECESQTSLNVATLTNVLIDEIVGPETIKNSLTVDGASSMQSDMLKNSIIENGDLLWCICHQLNLVISDVLFPKNDNDDSCNAADIVAVRTIVRFVKCSPIARAEIKRRYDWFLSC